MGEVLGVVGEQGECFLGTESEVPDDGKQEELKQ
jgi:hypothetical protein